MGSSGLRKMKTTTTKPIQVNHKLLPEKSNHKKPGGTINRIEGKVLALQSIYLVHGQPGFINFPYNLPPQAPPRGSYF